ncbi:MAG: zinc-binding dehydrogenase [Candidatus Sericytochromatia bacterium]
MKAIPINKAGEANSLKIANWPAPKIQADEILIKVKAFGINYADIMARKGIYGDAPPMPFIPGYEASGIIEKIGSKVSNFKVGQKVFALLDFGGYAEYVKAKELMCFPMPENLSFTECASIPVNFVTAYHALYNTGLFLEGSKVLIHAAAGGVGLSAIQLAKLNNCEIFGTAGSDKKIELLKEWGVQYPINYSNTDFETEIKKITQNKGVDIILDSIGGNYIKKGLNILAPHGRVVAFGASSLSERANPLKMIKLLPEVLSMFAINSIPMLMGSKGLYGVNMKALGEKPEIIKLSMDKIMELFKEEKLKTVISKVYPWEEIAQAHKDLESRISTGKLVLEIL